jgi:hypothetical protein
MPPRVSTNRSEWAVRDANFCASGANPALVRDSGRLTL